MTKAEAIKAMDEGKKVTHTYFFDDEYIFKETGNIYDESDIQMPDEFFKTRNTPQWETGWSIYTKQEVVTNETS